MKIAIVGANGFIGRNAARYFPNTILITRKTLDFMDFEQVESFFKIHRVDWIIHCASEGGLRHTEDGKEVTFNNLMMYHSFARLGIPMIYFSSGAALWNPTSPYGFCKLIIENMNHAHVHLIRVFGCHGRYEKSFRFSAMVINDGHVTIDQDRFFDYIHINDLMKIVENVVKGKDKRNMINAVYQGEKMKLSDFALKHGATYTILRPGLGIPYVDSVSSS